MSRRRKCLHSPLGLWCGLDNCECIQVEAEKRERDELDRKNRVDVTRGEYEELLARIEALQPEN